MNNFHQCLELQVEVSRAKIWQILWRLSLQERSSNLGPVRVAGHCQEYIRMPHLVRFRNDVMHLLTDVALPTNVSGRKHNQPSGPYCLRLIIWEALLILEQVGQPFGFHLAELIHQIVLEEPTA